MITWKDDKPFVLMIVLCVDYENTERYITIFLIICYPLVLSPFSFWEFPIVLFSTGVCLEISRLSF